MKFIILNYRQSINKQKLHFHQITCHERLTLLYACIKTATFYL